MELRQAGRANMMAKNQCRDSGRGYSPKNPWNMKRFCSAKKSASRGLTSKGISGTILSITTPGSFGERAQSHSERSGSCFCGGCS